VPEITARIVRSVKMYVGAIACNGVVTPKHIAALSPYRTSEDLDTARYAVLWYGDIGCLGGSGSITNHIAIVTVGPNGDFVVDPRLSSPAVRFDGYPSRSFPKLVGNTTDSIVLDGLDYDPDSHEGRCCPSLPVRLTARVDANGNWSIIDRKVRGSKPDAQPIIPPDLSRQAAPSR
jgi:hypothetical protein